MREQLDATTDAQRDSARSQFSDAVHRLRSATATSAAWAALVDHGLDEEMLSTLRRLDVIERKLGRDLGHRVAHRGDSRRSPMQAQMGFARLLVLSCHREAELERPSATPDPAPPKFLWLVRSLLDGAKLPPEGSELELAAVEAFSSREAA